MATTRDKDKIATIADDSTDNDLGKEVVNASGHKQELERNFSPLNICSIGITTGNQWVALGGSVAIAIYNGGPAGVIYEYVTVSVFYWFVAASIAELASAIPSSSGVYHWSFVTAGPYGRPVSFFAGHWNFLAWLFGAASMSAILGNQTVSMYALFHPDFEAQPWHVFVSFLLCTWVCCSIVLFLNPWLPHISTLGLALILAGVLLTILTCAITPSTSVSSSGYATASAIFTSFPNTTGWPSGFAFLLGMLNGAYAVGTPDCVAHLAEEMPQPSRNIPLAVLAQMATGFVTGFAYLLALFFACPDIDAALAASNAPFPLAALYLQATGASRAGALGLLLLAFLPTFVTCIGCYVTAGRTWWTLARDRAVPGSRWFGKISPRWGNPFYATVFCGALCTVLACIYVGNTTVFNSLVGSFVVLSSLSYIAAIGPHLLGSNARQRVGEGWFRMGEWYGWVVNVVAVVYMLVFVVVFCFPPTWPTDKESMNYSCVIVGGWTLLVVLFWLWRQGSYDGPPAVVVGRRVAPREDKNGLSIQKK